MVHVGEHVRVDVAMADAHESSYFMAKMVWNIRSAAEMSLAAAL